MNHIHKLALASALCAFPTLAQACSCAPPPAPKVALEKSAAVFVGKVISVEEGDFTNKYQIAVSKQWKGIKGKTTSIVTATNSAACGINFDKDRDYLIYAYKNEGEEQLLTNLCSRTARAADATADLAALGAPVKTVDADVTGTSNDKPLDMSQYYQVADNGDIQIGAKPSDDPLVVLAKALQDNKNAQRFRVNWKAPTDDSLWGTSLYNREDSTLKAYSRSETDAEIKVSSVLYSGVTDEILQKLSSTDQIGEFFRTYAQYGVTKKDIASKTVKLRSLR